MLSPSSSLLGGMPNLGKKGEEYMRNNLYYNGSGCPDPTAGKGIRTADKANDLVYICRYILRESGFELEKRIEIKHKATGRIYKQEERK